MNGSRSTEERDKKDSVEGFKSQLGILRIVESRWKENVQDQGQYGKNRGKSQGSKYNSYYKS